MTENIEHLETEKSKSNFYKWLFFISIVILIVIVGFYTKARMEDQNKYNQQNGQFNQTIKKLEDSNNSLTKDLNDKINLLSGYAPYLPLIKNLKLVDTAYKSLPYRYGQQIAILPDSTPAVINSIAVTANEFEYSVKYIVRTKNGTYVSISVNDILKSN